jgi:hypothetical protein
MTDGADFGPGALYPFCPWPRDLADRRPGRPGTILYCRDGNPDRVVARTERSAREGRAERVRRVDALEWYCARRPALFPRVFQAAGARLQETYERAVAAYGARALDPSEPPTRRSGPAPLNTSALDALEHLGRALDFVGGPELDDLLVAVICDGERMEAFERRHGWRAGSGQVVLRTALYRLAVHYGLVNRPTRRRRRLGE